MKTYVVKGPSGIEVWTPDLDDAKGIAGMHELAIPPIAEIDCNEPGRFLHSVQHVFYDGIWLRCIPEANIKVPQYKINSRYGYKAVEQVDPGKHTIRRVIATGIGKGQAEKIYGAIQQAMQDLLTDSGIDIHIKPDGTTI